MINESLTGNVHDTAEASKEYNSALEGQKRLHIGREALSESRRKESAVLEGRAQKEH